MQIVDYHIYIYDKYRICHKIINIQNLVTYITFICGNNYNLAIVFHRILDFKRAAFPCGPFFLTIS